MVKRNFLNRYPGVWIPILYLMVILLASSYHDTFEEWDGVMQYFAGREIVTGVGYNGWTSHFWPPLYSLLTGLCALLVPGFTAAKAVSIIAGVVTLLIAYPFAIELSGSKKVGLLTQLFLFLNPLFFQSTLQAENHMLDTMFFVGAIFLLLKIIKNESTNPRQFLYLGFITGIAGLCRYSSYALVPIAIVSIFLFINRRAFGLYAAFLIAFVVISLPWWIHNAVINGCPLHTWQYLNIGSHVYPDFYEWWWDAQTNFDSIIDIVIAYPVQYMNNFAYNFFISGRLIVINGGILAPLVAPAIFDSFISIKFKYWFILIGGLFVFVILVSQAFVFSQVFLCWIVVMTILSIMFLLKYIALAEEKFERFKKYHIGTVLIILFIVGGLGFTIRNVSRYISADDFDQGQLVRKSEVTRALIDHDPEIDTKYVMSINPARAYYAGSNWIMTPLHYTGTIDGFVEYRNIHQRIREYAPKYPSNTDISSLKADYLIYDVGLQKPLPQFSFLLDEHSKEVPSNFNLVFRSPEVAVYEIVWE